MFEEVFVFPDREVMLQRLLQVSDSHHLIEHLYPKFLKEAGEQVVPAGVVTLIVFAISDYTNGLPFATKYTNDLPSKTKAVLLRLVPEFIEAMIPDERLAGLAKDFYAALPSPR
jgi:hypothetical protein